MLGRDGCDGSALECPPRSLTCSEAGLSEGDWIVRAPYLVDSLRSPWLNVLLGSGAWLEVVTGA